MARAVYFEQRNGGVGENFIWLQLGRFKIEFSDNYTLVSGYGTFHSLRVKRKGDIEARQKQATGGAFKQLKAAFN